MYFCHLNASLLNKSIHFFLFFFFLSYWPQLLNSGVLLSSDIKEQIRHCRLTYFFGQCKTLWVSDGCKFFLFQLLDGLLLVSQIELGANQNNWSGRAVVPHLWIPLEGAEEQIRTINSLLIISPSLCSMVFLFACLLSNTWTMKLFICKELRFFLLFDASTACSICYQRHNPCASRSVPIQNEVKIQANMQFIPLDVCQVEMCQGLFTEKIFLRKAPTEYFVKAQKAQTMSVVSQKVCRVCEKCSKNSF